MEKSETKKMQTPNAFKNLDWQTLLKHLSEFATSEAGKTQLTGLQALPHQQQAEESFAQITTLKKVLSGGVRPFMESLDLFDTWFHRLEKDAVLKTIELKDVRHFLLEVLSTSEVLSEYRPEESWLDTVSSELIDAEPPLSAIDAIMTPRGEIRTDASETLYKLYREKEVATRNIESTLDKLVKDHEMESVLQDKYVTNREGRWVLPVKSGMQHRFGGIIHAASQSKQTVFMEPDDIIPLNNRVRQIEVEIAEEIERLLTQLSGYLSNLTNDLGHSRTILLMLDVKLAQAQLASQVNAGPVHFSDETISLKDLQHPVLVLNGDDVVANTVDLGDPKRILLLSGPNAGGKTVLLKSIGLAAQMARCGLLVCVEKGSHIPFFEEIYVGVGDAQSVDEQLSTFAAHLKVLDHATQAKGKKNLLLIDEICGSTDPEEGSALARSFIEVYSENQVFGVVTSHLGPLKGGWTDDSAVMNGSMEYDSKVGVPTYKFIMGIAGDSLAIQTAKRVGVNQLVLARTLDLLSPETRKRYSLNSEIELIKKQMVEAQENLAQKTKEVQKQKQDYDRLIRDFEREKSQLLKKELQKAESKVNEMIRDAEVQDVFQKHSSLQTVKQQLPEIIKAKPGETETQITTAEEFAKKFPAGSKVFVPSINQDALIQGAPNGKGEIPVLSNSMRLSVSWKELKPPRQNQNPTAKVLRQSGKFEVGLHDGQRVVDVRGKTVEVAIQELEIQLDQAATAQEDRVKIIHGHGTEVLKKAVRAYLSRSVYVTKWSAGAKVSGGDGVTWIELG